MRTFLRQSLVAGGVGAIVAAAACGDSTGVAQSGAQIGFVASSSTSASASMVPVTVGAHTLDVTAVKLTVSRVELKRAKTDACAGDDDDNRQSNSGPGSSSSGDDGCGELKIGPTTIDLPLTGTVVTLPANAIPAGTYRELELRVSDVRLTGTYDGKAFDVTLPVRVKSEVEFATPLQVTDGAATTVTVSVPIATWLVNGDGSLIDPSTIATSPTLLAQVTARVRASFRAFEDRDHDGRDDHGHGGRD